MAKLSDMKASPIKHIMVYGPPKAGKTELVGKLAEKFNLKWFDLEKGVSTLFKLPQEWQERIEVFQIPDTRGTPMAIETCLKVIKGAPMKICVLHGKVACPICAKASAEMQEIELAKLGPNDAVVFDSMTQLTNSAIANITRNQPDDYKLQRDDWGNLGKVMDTFLSYVQAAPFNVIVITHENMVDSVMGKDAGGQKLVPVAGTANFSRNSAKYFDEVVYCEVKNKKHIFASTTTYSNNIMTGGRSGFSLEKSLEPKLLDLWS